MRYSKVNKASSDVRGVLTGLTSYMLAYINKLVSFPCFSPTSTSQKIQTKDAKSTQELCFASVNFQRLPEFMPARALYLEKAGKHIQLVLVQWLSTADVKTSLDNFAFL